MNETASYKNVKHFEGLNSLRFLAAFLVVVSHAESIRQKNGLVNFERYGFFRNGGTAVTFFFVLSGFLITYLLLKERHGTNHTSIRNFYRNRVLRIWPLYFLLVGVGTIALPLAADLIGLTYEVPYTLGQTWPYFLFFLPGLVTFYYGHHFLEPLWSIGVEEVFYLFWAPLFKWLKRKIIYALYGIIAGKMLLLALGQLLSFPPLFSYLVSTFQFEAMAVGGLGAWHVFHAKRPLSGLKIYGLLPQAFLYAALLAYLFLHPFLLFDRSRFSALLVPLSTVLLQALFLYLIVGISLIGHNLVRLRSGLLSWLGEISYGIYMYQLVAISITMLLLQQQLARMSALPATLLFYAVLLAILVSISALSKRFFEDFFLKYKKHYSRLRPEGK